MTRSVFAAPGATTLRRLTATNVVLALDFDGTLAPIVHAPAAARMRPETRALLDRVARLYPTVVLTGRARADAARRLRGIPLRAIVGNHGLEGGSGGTAAAGIVRGWRRSLAALRRTAGVVIEDKGASLAVHFRGATDPARARRSILRAAAALTPAPRLVSGKALVNILPDLGVNKGTALRTLIRRQRARSAIYVGDDVTDEDVFGLPASARVLAIRVGRARTSTAPYFIASQRQIDLLLALLIDARSRT